MTVPMIPIDAEMYRTSAAYKWQVDSLRALVDHAERAMTAEGIEAAIRRRVISRIVLGGPDPEEARRQLAEQQAHIEKLKRTATPSILLPDPLDQEAR